MISHEDVMADTISVFDLDLGSPVPEPVTAFDDPQPREDDAIEILRVLHSSKQWPPADDNTP